MIVCAAIKHQRTGLIIAGPRHFDSIMTQQICNCSVHDWKDAEQGFLDEKGVFWNRVDAKMLARKHEQIIRRCGGDETELFSENLY